MFANSKDIVHMMNIRYKDTGIIDTNLNGHPVLVIFVEDDYFYYLTISSSSDLTRFTNAYQHFAIKSDKLNKFKAPVNYVNLKNIYREKKLSQYAVGSISDEKFKEVIKALKYYHETLRKDDLYDIIKDKM